MESSIHVKFNRQDRVYRENDTVEGVVIVNANKGWKHKGLRLLIEGDVRTRINTRYKGEMDSTPALIFKSALELTGPGSFPHGKTTVPFSFKLTTPMNMPLLETYHGAHIDVMYIVHVSCERGMTYRELSNSTEFVVEMVARPGTSNTPPIPIDIRPSTLSGITAAEAATLKQFHVKGSLHRSSNSLTMPLTGELIVCASEQPVASINLQLARKETISSSNFTSISEVQSIELADGNVVRNQVLPIYLIYPRLFTCPTLTDNWGFHIEWEVGIIITFADGVIVSETFPIDLYR